MTELPQWTLDEVLIRFDLEPSMAEVYVEGRSDQMIVDWFLSRAGISHHTVVYEISVIEFEPDFVRNNRQKVIAFAKRVEAKLAGKVRRFACIADKDFGGRVGVQTTGQYLLYTDFSCIEAYFANYKGLRKMSGLYFGEYSTLNKDTVDNMAMVLRQVFLIRLVKELLVLNIRLLDFIDLCRFENHKIHFEHLEFIQRMLIAAGKGTHKEKFIEKFNDLHANDKDEPRNCLHGHDFISLLTWVARKKGRPNEICRDEPVQRGLFGSAEYSDFAKYPMFQSLIQKVSVPV